MDPVNIADWFAAYPGSEKLDLGPKQAIAIFQSRELAEEFINSRWGMYGYVEPIRLSVELLVNAAKKTT